MYSGWRKYSLQSLTSFLSLNVGKLLEGTEHGGKLASVVDFKASGFLIQLQALPARLQVMHWVIFICSEKKRFVTMDIYLVLFCPHLSFARRPALGDKLSG